MSETTAAIKNIEWGSGNGIVSVDGEMLKTPFSAAGAIIERHLRAANIAWTTNWNCHYPKSADAPVAIWDLIRADVRDAITRSDTKHNESTKTTCSRCHASSANGAMFTTSRSVCDDCA